MLPQIIAPCCIFFAEVDHGISFEMVCGIGEYEVDCMERGEHFGASLAGQERVPREVMDGDDQGAVGVLRA
ncbi:MAG: hypothetical protein SGI92_20415 [Bryobacteraceae bacterium]|nr:hypothetical protein [Bryobacteraceae bacterium]